MIERRERTINFVINSQLLKAVQLILSSSQILGSKIVVLVMLKPRNYDAFKEASYVARYYLFIWLVKLLNH